MAASPHNLGYIWYSPNHVRAFRRSAYDEVGGYDAELAILDDQDLMCRLYLVGEFANVDRSCTSRGCTPRMTQLQAKTNATIQEQTVVDYRKHVEPMALAWAKRRGLRCLRLKTPRWIGDDPERGLRGRPARSRRSEAPGRGRQCGTHQVLRRAEPDSRPCEVVQRGLPGTGARRSGPHPDPEHRWTAAPSRIRARLRFTTRTVLCTSPRRLYVPASRSSGSPPGQPHPDFLPVARP